jgi:putative transposase
MSIDRQIPFYGFDPRQGVDIARRRLPHWRQEGATYFITFRLADSLPQSLLRQWEHEREIWLRWHPLPWSVDEQLEYEHRFINRLQE